MATFTVTTTADSGAGSLRQAVADANALAGADEIVFDASVFNGEAADLIRLTSGQITITDALTIVGGPAGVTITGDANGDDVTLAGGITDVAASLAGEDRLDDNSRIFDATAALTLDGLALTGGRTTADGEGGGAVRGTSFVTLTNSTLTGNSTAGDHASGGGIHGLHRVTLTNSTVSGNSTAGYRASGGGVLGIGVSLTDSAVSGNSTAGARAYGGGVFDIGPITLTNSTVSGNSTSGDFARGGGIISATVTLTSSTVSGNSTAGDSARGGGVWGSAVTLANSTVSGNSTGGIASAGGGVFGYEVTLTNSTVSGNSTAGDGAYGGGLSGGDVTLTNSIVSGNVTTRAGVAGDEVGFNRSLVLANGNIVGGDLFDGATDVGDVTAAEVFAATEEIAPGVFAGVLGDNGGPTRTILIATDGPAVDAGGGTPAFAFDQRGAPRFSGAAVDLGAVEIQTTPPVGGLVVDTALDVVDASDGLTSLREAVIFANTRVGADTITFDPAVFDGGAAAVIRLTGGQLGIADALTIIAGPAGVTITGDADGDDVTLAGGITDVAASLDGEDRLDDNSRIFDATAALTLDGLTLTGGRTTTDGEGGGAVRGTTVALIDSTVSGSSTAGDSANGGAVWGGTVTLTNSAVSDNRTAGYFAHGGGVYGYAVTVTNSTVSGNSTAGYFAPRGGGVSGIDVTLINSTVSGNSTAGYAARGGGVDGRTVTLINSTVSGNSTAGDYAHGGGVSGSIDMTNSIVLGNTAIGWRAAGDEVSRITALTGGNIVGGDLFDGAADVGDVTAAGVFAATEEIAPGVFAGVLADNGGPTRTIAIRADGPAAGAADPASATATDQRGFARDAAPDLGAFEAGAGGGGLTLVGGPGPDALTGSDFADSLRGLGGDDLLRGRGGDDLVIGGAGCDVVRGGAGDDVVRGGKGRDVIFGGLGDDVLHGGACPDRFVFRADFGDDVIADFDADPAGGQDRIDLRPLGITEASFAAEVAIVVDGGDTRIEVAGQGAIVCLGVDGIGANAVDRADFLLA